MENAKVQKTLIIPFVKYEEIIINGERHHDSKDNLTNTDINYLGLAGYTPVFLTNNESNEYLMASDLPLYFNGGTSIKEFICYLFDDLSEEDKIIFKDKTEEINLLIKDTKKEEGEIVEAPKRSRRRLFRRN